MRWNAPAPGPVAARHPSAGVVPASASAARAAPTRRSRRSRLRARCEPRLVGTMAWISSMITASTPARVSRAAEVSSRYSDSGVVMSRSGGWRWSRRRSSAGVSPVRRPTVGRCTSVPSRSAASDEPSSGARRFFSTSTARARRGDRYSTRVRWVRARAPVGGGVLSSRSMPHRKAVSVLPEPVGASTSVCSPEAMGGQACTWASVGAANVVENQAWTGAENRSRAGWGATDRRLPRGGDTPGRAGADRPDGHGHRARHRPGAGSGSDGGRAER